jgi:hypothetical protein
MNTTNPGQPSGRLPVTRNLAIAYGASLIIAIMIAVVSVVGLIYQDVIYPTDKLLLAFAPSDAVNLVVGLPILLGAMWLARRGSLVGLLCWPGALFYVLYMYVPYVISVPFSVLFLPHLVLAVLSAYALIGLVASVDGEAVRQRLISFVPARASGGILVALAILVIVRQTALIGSALTNQTPHDALPIATWIADFMVSPMVLVGGILLWRRNGLGYVAGAGLLLGYGVLALSLIPFLVLQASYTASPIDVAGIMVVLVMAAICLIPFAFFVRGAASDAKLAARALQG